MAVGCPSNISVTTYVALANRRQHQLNMRNWETQICINLHPQLRNHNTNQRVTASPSARICPDQIFSTKSRYLAAPAYWGFQRHVWSAWSVFMGILRCFGDGGHAITSPKASSLTHFWVEWRNDWTFLSAPIRSMMNDAETPSDTSAHPYHIYIGYTK